MIPKSLVPLHDALPESRREDLAKLALTKGVSPNELAYLDRRGYSPEQQLDILDVARTKQASVYFLGQLLEHGFETGDLEEILDIKEDYDNSSSKPVKRNIDGFEYFVSPIQVGSLSYANLMFLDELAGGTKDTETLERTVEETVSFMEQHEIRWGLAVFLREARDQYDPSRHQHPQALFCEVAGIIPENEFTDESYS